MESDLHVGESGWVSGWVSGGGVSRSLPGVSIIITIRSFISSFSQFECHFVLPGKEQRGIGNRS